MKVRGSSAPPLLCESRGDASLPVTGAGPHSREVDSIEFKERVYNRYQESAPVQDELSRRRSATTGGGTLRC